MCSYLNHHNIHSLHSTCIGPFRSFSSSCHHFVTVASILLPNSASASAHATVYVKMSCPTNHRRNLRSMLNLTSLSHRICLVTYRSTFSVPYSYEPLPNHPAVASFGRVPACFKEGHHRINVSQHARLPEFKNAMLSNDLAGSPHGNYHSKDTRYVLYS